MTTARASKRYGRAGVALGGALALAGAVAAPAFAASTPHGHARSSPRDHGGGGGDHHGGFGHHGGFDRGGLVQTGTGTYPAPFKTLTAFDISYVDPVTHTYFVADHTNGGVAAFNTTTDAFEGLIGQGDFAAGGGPKACGPFNSGPTGVLAFDIGGSEQIWAGDGTSATQPVSSVKVFVSTTPGSGTLAATIPTGGTCRADEMAYDPVDHLVAIANPNDTTPYVSFISVNANPAQDKVVGTLKFPQAIDGLEQTVWDPATDQFLVPVPQVPTTDGTWQSQIETVSPSTFQVVGTFTLKGCSPAGLALDPGNQNLLVGCSSDAMAGDVVNGVTYPPNPAVTYVINARTGDVVSKTGRVGGSDEVAFDPASDRFYTASSSMTSNGLPSGYPTPVLGIISALDGRYLASFPTGPASHSLAADPASGKVFVPVAGYGIAVFQPVH